MNILGTIMAIYDNHDKGRHNDDNEGVKKVILTLNHLPKVKAAPDFELQLHQRINTAQVSGREILFLERIKSRWPVPAFAVSILAFLCVGVIAYYSLLNRGISPTAPLPQQPMIQASSDSAQNEAKKQYSPLPTGTAEEKSRSIKSAPYSSEATTSKKIEPEVQEAKPVEMQESKKEIVQPGSQQNRVQFAPQFEQQAGKGIVPETFKVQTKDARMLQKTFGVSTAVDTASIDTTKQRQDSLKALQKAKQLKKQ